MKRIALALLLTLALAATALAEPLTIAAGAGYKKFVTELAGAYEAKTGQKPELIFGNMGQVVAQTRASGKIHMIIGEQGFLTSSGLPMASFTALGQGVLVVAWPRGGHMAALADVAGPKVKRVAMPDPAKAIYGIAGKEALAKAGLADKLGERLLIVATVPQVTTYVVTGEVDAGLTNLTDVMNLGDKIGGYFKVDQALYKPIVIGAFVPQSAGADAAVAAFLGFAASEQGRAVARKHGL